VENINFSEPIEKQKDIFPYCLKMKLIQLVIKMWKITITTKT